MASRERKAATGEDDPGGAGRRRDPARAAGRRRARAVGRRRGCCAARRRSSSWRSCSRTSICARSTRTTCGARRTSTPSRAGRGVHRLHRAQRGAYDRGGAPDEGALAQLAHAAAGAVALGLIAVALQCIEYTPQHFGPTNGAYASVFCAWTALLPDRRAVHDVLAGDAGRDRAARPPRTGRAARADIKDPDRLIAPALDAAVFYWAFLAGDRGHHLRGAVPPLVLATAAAHAGLLGLVVRPAAGAGHRPRDLLLGRATGARSRPQRKRVAQRWRSACFYARLVVLAIALASPIERLSAQLFWVHMIQHVLLLIVAAPLFVVARPWIRLWRCLPLTRAAGWRAASARGSARRRCARSAARSGSPVPSFVAFSVVLLAWHLPVLFDATLRSTDAARARAHAVLLHGASCSGSR